MSPSPRSAPLGKFVGQVLAAASGAVALTPLAAALDLGASARPLLVLVDASLLVPVAVLVAPFAVALAAALGPMRAASSSDAVRRRSARLLVLGVAVAVALAVLPPAELAVASRGPAVVGAVRGLSVLALAALALTGLRGADRWAASAAPLPAPALAATLGVLAAAVPVGLGALTGTVGGSGGVFGVYGVLREPELDLRPVLASLALAGGAGVGLALRARAPRWLSPAILVAGVAAWVPAWLLDDAVALELERSAALARRALLAGQALADRDGDGASGFFGGGDCDDGDPRRSPSADDVPDNGIDEDCTGSDAKPFARPQAPPADPAAGAPSAAAVPALPKVRGVVVLTIDALRWDALRSAGAERPLTPALDALAERSVVFERAYSLASYTGKSLPGTFIGKYPSETHRGWAHFNRIVAPDVPLWTRLQQAGVRTLSAQGYWYFYQKGYGFDLGWDRLDSSAAPAVMSIEGGKDWNSHLLADKTIELLREQEGTQTQFFFWTHYVDPHADYVGHEGFEFGKSQRDLYDSEVAFTSAQVGRILDYLATSPLGAETAIIISSDHGEAFGEHGMIRHGFEVWEELVRVPLIVHVPGVAPRRVSTPRSLVDLAPTVLDLLGLPHPDGDSAYSGISWKADLIAPPDAPAAPRPVLVDMPAGPYNGERQAYLEGDLKLIARDGKPVGFYDLARDPGEKQNLLADDPRAPELVERYKAFRRSLRVVTVKPG